MRHLKRHRTGRRLKNSLNSSSDSVLNLRLTVFVRDSFVSRNVALTRPSLFLLRLYNLFLHQTISPLFWSIPRFFRTMKTSADRRASFFFQAEKIKTRNKHKVELRKTFAPRYDASN